MDAVRLRSSDTFSTGKWYSRQKQDCKCLKGGKGWGNKPYYLFPTQNAPRISVRHKLCSVHGYHGTSTNCGMSWNGQAISRNIVVRTGGSGKGEWLHLFLKRTIKPQPYLPFKVCIEFEHIVSTTKAFHQIPALNSGWGWSWLEKLNPSKMVA